MHDVMIIGGGPAGMTAAIYAARKVLDQVLISPDVGGQATWASEIENYLGYPYISGFDLALKFESHLKGFGVERVDDRVASLEKRDDFFIARTEGGAEFESRAAIVTSGKSARNLGVIGEEEFKGRGVTYCATCDAPLYKGKDVAVVGGGNAGVSAAIQLSRIANQVYLIEVMRTLTADRKFQQHIKAAQNVRVLTYTDVTEIHGNKVVEGIAIKDLDSGRASEIPVGGVFIEIGSMPNTSFLFEAVKVNRRGEVMIDCANNTNIKGLFAAGDATNIPHKQIIIAAGEGAKALLSAHDYLIRHSLGTK